MGTHSEEGTIQDAAEKTPLNIMRVVVSNFGVITFAAITPEGNVVRLTGEAGSGKTTIIMALRTLVGGKSYAPAMPIRVGAQKAEILLILGADGQPLYRIRQTFTGKSESFVVTDADGKPVPSPRAFMAGLVGSKLALDPASFLRLAPADQAQAVLKAAGVDLAPLDAESKAAFDARTESNRLVAKYAAQLKGMPEVDLPADAKEESLQEVLTQQQALLKAKQKNDEVRAEAREARRRADEAQRAYETTRAEVARVEQELEALQAKLAAVKDRQQERMAAAAQASDAAETKEEAAAKLEDPNLTAVTMKLTGLEDHNRKVAQRTARAAKAAELKEAEVESDRLSAIIEAVATKKKQLLGSIDLGVPELRVDDGQLMYGMVPFEQASMSQKLLGALAVGLNTDTRLPLILLEEAAFLSPEKLRELAEFAEKRGAMIWIERPLVDGSNPGVRLVAGSVEGAESESAEGQGDQGM